MTILVEAGNFGTLSTGHKYADEYNMVYFSEPYKMKDESIIDGKIV